MYVPCFISGHVYLYINPFPPPLIMFFVQHSEYFKNICTLKITINIIILYSEPGQSTSYFKYNFTSHRSDDNIINHPLIYSIIHINPFDPSLNLSLYQHNLTQPSQERQGRKKAENLYGLVKIDGCGFLHTCLNHFRGEEISLSLAFHCDLPEILLRQ